MAWSLGLSGLAAVSLQKAVPAEVLLLDASVVGGGRWYAGLVTSLTVMGWTVAAVSLGFASLASRISGRRSASMATGSIALIVAVLMLDDLFLLHSALAPTLFGGSKWALVLLEGIAAIAWSIWWRSEITRTRWELLVAASAGFAVSLAFDRFGFGHKEWTLIAEDGAKVLGVLALATWAVSTAADLIRSLVQHAVAAAEPTGARIDAPDRPANTRSRTPTGPQAPGVVDRSLERIRSVARPDA